MANWTTLKAAIASVIKTNGNQEITGQLLQNVLNNIVSSLGENATFAGIATPTTNPGTPDGPVFYIVSEAGTYTNFGGLQVTDEVVILLWNGTSWTKKSTGFATAKKLTELGTKQNNLTLKDGATSAERSCALNFDYFILYDLSMEYRICVIYNDSSVNHRIIIRRGDNSVENQYTINNAIGVIKKEKFEFKYNWDKHTQNINNYYENAKIIANQNELIPLIQKNKSELNNLGEKVVKNLMPTDISAATSIANIMANTKAQLTVNSTLENTILHPTHLSTNFPNYNVQVFDVTNIDIVQIVCSKIIASGNSLAFAFYKELELAADEYIRGISFTDLGTKNINKFLNVPLDAKALAISDRADNLSNWTINKIVLGNSRIEENAEKIIRIDKDIYPIGNNSAKALSNIFKTTQTPLLVNSTLENTILYPTRLNTNFPNYNVQVFDVTNIDIVQIVCSKIIASGNSLAFAFYKELELAADEYIRGISFTDLGTKNINKFLNVPLDAKALAISDRADNLSNWTINKIVLGNSRIEENAEKIIRIDKDIYPIGNNSAKALSNIFKTTQTPLLVNSTIENSLMRYDGSLWSNFADHNLQLYAVSDIDIIRVECAEIKASGKTLAFAFYKESEITVGNFIWGISYNDLGRRDLNDYLYVPQGAKYLVICDRNDFLPSWTINKIVLGNSRIEENVVEIACWGDSITAGTATPNYPTWLQKLLNTTVINLGCGSAWIQDISARQGGVPALILSEVSVPSTTEPFAMDYNNVYNAYQSKEFQLAPRYQIENAELAYNPVIIDNVEFNFKFSYDNGVKLHISRLVGGKEFTIRKGTPIYPNSISKYRDWFNVFFMGTNNTSGYNTDLSAYTETIISYHDDCISMLNTANYLVLGLFNIGQRIYNRDEAEKLTPTDAEILEQYITYETKMRKTYGLRFIALRELLASQKAIDDAVSLGYMTQVQATTNQTIDQEWIAKGCVPKSFMVYSGNDYVHPNAVGYKMIAYYVSIIIKKMLGL